MKTSDMMTKKKINLKQVIELCEKQDAHAIFEILDKLTDPCGLPYVVHLKNASAEAHSFAKRVVQDWQEHDVPTWTAWEDQVI